MSANFFEKLAPYLAGTGASLVNLDENGTGPDDVAGEILLYAAQVVLAVTSGATELPPLPPILSDSVAGKISGPARTAIIVATGPLTVAEFQLAASKPRFAKALGYVRQVLTALAAGKPVPAAPPSLA